MKAKGEEIMRLRNKAESVMKQRDFRIDLQRAD